LAVAKRSRSTYYRLQPYLQPYLGQIVRGTVCMVVFIGSMPLLAHILGEISKALAAGQVSQLITISLWTLGLFGVRGITQYGQQVFMAAAALAMARDVRVAAYAHLHRLDLAYFGEARAGDLSYRLTEDVDRLGEAIGKFFYQFLPSVLQLIFVLIYLCWLDWQMMLVVAAIAPAIGYAVAWFGQQMLERSHRSQARVSNLSSVLAEVFAGVRAVRAFGTETYEIQRFRQEAEENRRAQFAGEQIKAVQYPVVGLMEAAGIALLLVFAGWQIGRGVLSPNAFVAFGAGVALLIDPIVNSTSSYNELKQTEASCERVFELLAIAPTVTDPPHPVPLPLLRGEIEYRGVTFAYGDNPPVLHNIHLRVWPGETVALVGGSGSGKSTLVSLLLRFYDPQAGSILLDGIDIRTVALADLRQAMALVPQDTVLFAGTIAENLAFGRTFALDEIVAAARIANAYDFVMQLPEGFQTRVGERGINLSGGQRQRLAIARAVLRNPKILILDEATSALDAESEALVQEALQRVTVNRTTVVIAHRLATVRRCDRIFVVEQGQIVESGNHEELLQQGGRYAQLCARQFAE